MKGKDNLAFNKNNPFKYIEASQFIWNNSTIFVDIS